MSTKHPRYAKRSRKLSRKQLYGIAVVSLVVVSLLAVYAFYNQPSNEFKAAIVDQLSLTYSNPDFASAINKTLNAAGYSLTYHNGPEVRVDFYRNLPTHGYKIILLRVHSALYNGNSSPLDFFTSEPYDHYAHVDDQIAGWLDIAMYHPGDKERYFGILHGFVDNAMRGSFQDAVVIMMGCNGMDGRGYSLDMVEALVRKGAKAVIGWNGTVSAYHTDIATEKLLQHLLIENKTIKDAVNATNKEVGREEGNELIYYPLYNPGYPYYSRVDVGNYTIPHGPQKSVATEMSGDYAPNFRIAGVSALPLLLSAKELCVSGRFRRKTF